MVPYSGRGRRGRHRHSSATSPPLGPGRQCAMQLRDERCARSGEEGATSENMKQPFALRRPRRNFLFTSDPPLSHRSPHPLSLPLASPSSLGSPPHRCPPHRGWRALFLFYADRKFAIVSSLLLSPRARARLRGGDEREKCGSENKSPCFRISSPLVRTGEGHGAW